MLPLPQNQPSIPQQQVDEGEAKRRQRGTGFTNISKILGANVGAGQKMGQAIGGQLGQQAEQIRKGIEQGQSQFQTGLQKGIGQEAQKIGRATGALGDIMSGTSVPTVDYEKIGTQLKGAEYAGPQNIENIQQQQQQAANLAALGKLSGMSGGQEELLRSQVAGRGRYGLGQTSLDALLLGKEGQKQLQQARTQTGRIASEAGQAEKMAQAQAQAAASNIESQKQSTINKLQQNLGEVQQAGTQSAEKFVSDVNRLKDLISGNLKVGEKITPEDEKLLSRFESGEFGNVDQGIFTGEEGATKATLSALAGAMSPNIGGRYYTKEQQDQAAKLATILSGQKAGQDISNLTYKTKLYDPTQDTEKGIFGAQEEARNRAIESAKQQDLAPVKAMREAIQKWGHPYYELLDQWRPGIRAIIDKVPFKKNREAMFMQVANQMMADISNRVANTDYNKDPRIVGQQKSMFSTIRQRLGLPEQQKTPSRSSISVKPGEQKE